MSAYATKEIEPMVKETFAEHKLPEDFARRIIDGVPVLAWGRGKDCTFPGALEAALKVTAHPYSYEDLMGFSGLAFRVRWHDGWCPSCTVGEMEEEMKAITQATGWQLRVKLGKGGADMERFTDEIVAEVNAGRSVLVYPPDLNVAVAYGYEDRGRTLFRRDYMKGDRERPMPTRELGFLLIFLGEHREPVPAREALARSLQIAARNWRRGTGHEGPADYRYGEAALRRWSKDLDRADDLSQEDRKKLFFLTWLNFNTVADARRAAESFLQARGSLLEGKARQALDRAAALYKEEGRMLGGLRGTKDAFLGPWTGKKLTDWTPDVRRREMKALEDVARHEAAAIAELERACSPTPTGSL